MFTRLAVLEEQRAFESPGPWRTAQGVVINRKTEPQQITGI